jgi:hypothetical protein
MLKHTSTSASTVPITFPGTALLDFASDRLLLKKLGGGCLFYHRMLMEHLARQ